MLPELRKILYSTDLSKGSTWKDIIFELFDKAMILSDGQVTPDEIIEAILDGTVEGMKKYDLQVGLIHIVPSY